MPSKTVTFNFLKKIKLKFDEANTGFKLGKKKIYGIQLLEFDIHFGLRDSKNLTYLCIPVKIVKDEILAKDQSVKGFNLGTNIGKVSGQSILHCHFHLIPRREGDVENPQGGVRSVIPNKQHYERKK